MAEDKSAVKATGFCVKEKRKNAEMANAQIVTMKNGRKAMKGVCAKCGCGMYSILGKDAK